MAHLDRIRYPLRRDAGRIPSTSPGMLLGLVLLFGLVPSLARADGEIDAAFGVGGAAIEDLGHATDRVAAMAIAPSGRILIAGDTANANRDMVVVALRDSGAIDTTFAGSGRVIADFGGDERAAALAIARDGKIVVVGTRVRAGLSEAVVLRYLPNGSLDTSFHGTGRRVLAFTDDADSVAAAVAHDLDGRIVIAGTRTGALGSVIALARLWPDGALDTSFDGNGKRFIDFGLSNGRSAFGSGVAIQDDGKILVAGRRSGAAGSDFAVARVHPDGSFDADFGSRGKTDVDFGADDDARALTLRPDGRIVVAGVRTAASGSDFAVAVLRADGAPDTSFKGNGKASTDFGASEAAFALTAQPDGKIVVVGERDGANGKDFAIARYLPDGSMDATLDGDGRARVDLDGGTTDSATAVALQGDGRILVAGTTASRGNANLGVVRLLSTAGISSGVLEIPAQGSVQSGIGLISGWLCNAAAVTVRIDGAAPLQAGYGTARADTLGACGDANNGLGLLFNWNLLGDGPHVIRAFADGKQFAFSSFHVATLGTAFLRGASGTYSIPGFPSPGSSVTLSWAEPLQNFVIGTPAAPPALVSASPTAATDGRLENPAPGSVQSGIGLLSGWACNAAAIDIRLDGGPPIRAAYGTDRGDTTALCGDANNGFGLLFNWNLLGSGIHLAEVHADGVLLASASFEVQTLGVDFLRGASASARLPSFPTSNRSVDVRWSESQQNFVIIGAD